VLLLAAATVARKLRKPVTGR